MNKLSEAEIAEFNEIFGLADTDRDGSIKKAEFISLMETLGIDSTPEELDRMFNEVDLDGSGEIDFDEFMTVMSIKIASTNTPDDIKNAFRVFEAENPSGFVSAETLIKALSTYSTNENRLTREQARDLVSQVEVDENGLINYRAFVDAVLS